MLQSMGLQRVGHDLSTAQQTCGKVARRIPSTLDSLTVIVLDFFFFTTSLQYEIKLTR